MGEAEVRKRKAAIARYYDERSGFWSEVYTGQWDSFGAYEIVRRERVALRLVAERAKSASKIVDVGCGSGALLIDLLRRGHQVAGIDLSEGMVQAAHQAIEDGQYVDRAECLVGDVEDLPWEAGSFDAAMCVGVLSHLLSPERAVAEMSRVVVDDGFVVATVVNAFKLKHLLDPYSFVRGISRLARRMLPRTRGAGPGLRQSVRSDDLVLRNYHFGELGGLLERDGLAVHTIVPCTFGPLSFWGREVLPLRQSIRLSVSLERLARRRGFGLLRLFANFWVILLDKPQSQQEEPVAGAGQRDSRHP